MISLQKEIKVLVIGSSGVGKTSLMKQFCRCVPSITWRASISLVSMTDWYINNAGL